MRKGRHASLAEVKVFYGCEGQALRFSDFLRVALETVPA